MDKLLALLCVAFLFGTWIAGSYLLDLIERKIKRKKVKHDVD